MSCSGLSHKAHPQLVSFEEVVEHTVRLSGVSRKRFQEVDSLPCSKLHLKVGDARTGDVSVIVVPARAAKWNSSIASMAMIQERLERAHVFFDPGNEYGKSATFSADATGSVILVCRGQCSLADKARNAAVAGALAVIVQNSEPGLPDTAMSAGDSEPSIPGFMVSQEGGNQLRGAVVEGRSVEIQVADLRPSTFFECLGGERPIRMLVGMFYRRAFADSEVWFREIFAQRDEATAIQNLADFLIQRFGGPSFYGERRGPAQMVSRHMNFEMKPGSAERWLHHMDEAIAKIKSWDAQTIALLKDYFRYQAHFLAYSYAAAYPEGETDAVGCCGGGCNNQDGATSLANPHAHAHTETHGSAVCTHLTPGLPWLCTLHWLRPAILPGLAFACLGLGIINLGALVHRRKLPLSQGKLMP